MMDGFFAADLVALASVIVIDLVLAGDNALVVGMVANRLAPAQRLRAIAIGIALAIAFRVLFALFAVKLLAIVGLLTVGGLLLLWVAWKLWSDIRVEPAAIVSGAAEAGLPALAALGIWGAIYRITVADISMSLDNVLAVAGAARHNTLIMGIGLTLSIILMAAAASLIAKVLDRHRWLNYLGLGIIVIVAFTMIYEGSGDVLPMARRALNGGG
jgi:YjbE family integral membrane protein